MGNIPNFNQLMGLLTMVQNPNAALQQFMGNNPQAKTLINQINSSGMTPAQYLMQYAKQNNMNIQPIKKFLQDKGIKF